MCFTCCTEGPPWTLHSGTSSAACVGYNIHSTAARVTNCAVRVINSVTEHVTTLLRMNSLHCSWCSFCNLNVTFEYRMRRQPGLVVLREHGLTANSRMRLHPSQPLPGCVYIPLSPLSKAPLQGHVERHVPSRSLSYIASSYTICVHARVSSKVTSTHRLCRSRIRQSTTYRRMILYSDQQAMMYAVPFILDH